LSAPDDLASETKVGQSVPPKRNRLPAAALLLATTVSMIGSAFTYVALPWFVLQTTGSAAKTGLTGFFVALPAFIAGVFGGTLVDKLGFKRSSIVSDLVSALGILAIPLLYDTIGLAFWQLLIFVFIGALLEVPGVTARRSLLPEMATMGQFRLEQLNSGFESINALSILIGPPVAGILIGLLAAGNVLWIDGASFLFSAIVVGFLVPALRPSEAERASGRYLDELKAGLRFLRADRLLLGMAICVGIANFLGAPLFSVVLPVWVNHYFGKATILGLIGAVAGAALLTGALGYGAIGHRLSRRRLWLINFAVAPIAIWVMGFTHALVIVIPATLITNFFLGPIGPLLVTVRHERIPASMRGRVFATFSAITAVAMPLGMVISGLVIQELGITTMLILLAVLTTLLGLAMPFLRFVYDFDASQPQADAPDD
jgi:MFS family permease